MLPVAISSPVDSPPAMVAAAVDACARALVRCREGKAEAGEVAASFRWGDGRLLSVRVTVEMPSGRREQSLQFAPGDPEIERWRSVGVVIALLAADAPEPAPAASSAAPAASAAPVASASASGAPVASAAPVAAPSAAPPARPLVRGAVGVLVTSGLDGQPRGGGEARIGVGWASVAYGLTLPSERGGVTEQLSWIALGVSSAPLRGGWVSLAGRVELLAERIDAELEQENAHDARARWVGGGRLGFDAVLPLGRGVGLGASIEAGLRSGRTRVFRNGQVVGDFLLFRPGAGFWLGYGF